MIARIARIVDERAPARAKPMLRKVFPDHWSFLLGEVALYSFMVLVLTGVYLSLFYVAGSETVVYDGSYEPLVGVPVSQAFDSVMRISYDRRGGIVIRQAHHWASLVFTGALLLHLSRLFFTGAFRRPRRLNWTVGVTMLALVLANGFFGLSLPDDLLSGTGLRVAHTIGLSIPVVGPAWSWLVFAGEFPAPGMFHRLYWIHVLGLPLAIALLLGVHLFLVFKQTHTQFPGGGRNEGNVVGDRAWPVYALKTVGLFALVAGVIVTLGGLVQISPVWIYGPYDAAAATVPAQPDWYLWWVEGALRVFPPFGIHLFGYEIPVPFFSGALLPIVWFALLYAWPFIEERATGDRAQHHVLDRPRDRPVRTAIGVTALTFLGVLLAAASHDLQGLQIGVGVDGMTVVYRVLVVVLPPLSGVLAWKSCNDLREQDRVEAIGPREAELKARDRPPVVRPAARTFGELARARLRAVLRGRSAR